MPPGRGLHSMSAVRFFYIFKLNVRSMFIYYGENNTALQTKEKH